MDEDLAPGLADETPPPETQSQTETQESPAVPDYVEIKNRDDVWEVDRGAFQQVADALGMDVDRLKTAVSIGVDGNRAYERLNQDREELQSLRQELAQMERSIRQGATRAVQPSQSMPPAQPMPRPPANDVTGNLLWMAERLERLGPVLDRVPVIEQALTETRAQYEADMEDRQAMTERAYALQAYQDTVDLWKQKGWGEVPSREKLEGWLRRIPISDDVDASWHDIWSSAAWAVAGPDVARRQRREQTRDAMRPGARITVPTNQAPLASAPASASSNGQMSERDMQDAEQALQGVTLRDLVSGQR